MINIYGLKNCDSCRKAIKWLNDNNHSYEFFDFKKNSITKNKITKFLRILVLIHIKQLYHETYSYSHYSIYLLQFM